MSILENKIRVGAFTSSEIHRLMSNNKQGTAFGAPGISYIAEKNLERKLGRSLDLGKGSNATLWGQFLEQRVHDLMPVGYELMSKVTMPHPEYKDIWVGSQDNVVREESCVCDTKCYEPQKFAEYNDALIKAKATGDLSEWKKDYAKEYWQLISNACIWGFKYIEVILYMPYESELVEIKQAAIDYEDTDQWKYRFIYETDNSGLAYLPDGNAYYKNLNVYRFEAPEADKEALKERVLLAAKELIPVQVNL
jgi:hypothetical protein